MRRCVRCSCWKPDASFLKADNGYAPGRCLHCRSILAELKISGGRGGQIASSIPPRGPEKIEASDASRALAMYAEAERRLFAERGARYIARPYIHDARGSLIGRASTKKKYSGGFTTTPLGR